MEALTLEQQANIRKMSSERLRVYLLKAGRDEEEVMTWDRNQLIEEWAIEVGKSEEEAEEFKASPASPVQTELELQKQRLEFERYKYEREERRREEEREERKKERERQERKEERERE